MKVHVKFKLFPSEEHVVNGELAKFENGDQFIVIQNGNTQTWLCAGSVLYAAEQTV